MTLTLTPQFFSVNVLGMYATPRPDDAPQAATRLLLSELGLSAGELIIIERAGDYRNGSQSNPDDTRTSLIVTFDGPSGPVAARSDADPFIYELDPGEPGPVDVAEDISIGRNGNLVEVPAGATHIVFNTGDPFVRDNSDPDGDYGVRLALAPADAFLFTDGPDVFDGGDGEDRVFAGEGNDILRGNGGDDSLFGEGGDDQIFGGDGHDRLDGGDGDDLLDASGGSVASQGFGDFARPGLGSDTIIGHEGLWNAGDGIDLHMENLRGIGGITFTLDGTGSGTAVSTDG